MKFGFEFNKKEAPEYNRSESADRPEDITPARPELQNGSLENTFSYENQGKDARKEYVPVEEIADDTTGEDEIIDALDAKIASSRRPKMDESEGPFESSEGLDPDFYGTIGRAEPEFYERVTNRIIELLEQNPDNFSDLLQNEISVLSPDEAQKIFKKIEEMNLVTKTEDYVLDNEGKKIEVASSDPEADTYEGQKIEDLLNKEPNRFKANYFDGRPSDMKQVWQAFKQDLQNRDPGLLHAMEEAEKDPSNSRMEYRRMWSNMIKRFGQFREQYASLKKEGFDREAIRTFLDEINDSINENNFPKDLTNAEEAKDNSLDQAA